MITTLELRPEQKKKDLQPNEPERTTIDLWVTSDLWVFDL